MLSKPGEARPKTAATAPSTRRRKVAEENLEDAVRKLQRLPCNKVCADCQSKLPQCVNLSHGTFICMACSGVHREFSHKIKGIGHSSFTAEEVAMLRLPHSGNEAVNARYLAKYSSHDRTRPPKDNSDLHALRAWIQRKYIDKAWLQDIPATAGDAAPTAPPKQRPSATPQTAPPGRRKILPTANASQSGDLFGIDAISPSSSSAWNGDSWDAFGTLSTQSQGQSHAASKPEAFADFGNASSFQPDFGVMNDHSSSVDVPSFSAKFGTTSWQGHSPQPTVVPLPPQSSSGHESFANFEQTQVPQPSLEAKFEQFHQQEQQPPMFSANFDAPSLQMPSVPKNDALATNTVATTKTNPAINNFDNFQPNFDQISMSHTMTQPPNNTAIAMTNQQTDKFGCFEASFDTVDSSFPIQQTLSGGMTTGNLGQLQGQTMETTRQPQQQQHKQPSQQLSQISISQGTAAIPQVNLVSGKEMVKQQHVNVEINDATVDTPMYTSAPPITPANQEDTKPAPPALNPNAFRSVEEDKMSAFDAFEGLSVEPTPALMECTGANSGDVSGVTSSVGDCSQLGAGNAMATIPDALKVAKLQETVMLLQSLSMEQLLQVQQYITSLGSGELERMGNVYGVGAATSMNGDSMMGSIPNYHPNSGMRSLGSTGTSLEMSMPMGGTVVFNGQPSMSQFQQFPAPEMQPIGISMGLSQSSNIPETSITNAYAPAALPPVEKEGNPFDMY